MTSKNFKIKNGLDIGDVTDVITVSNGVATITGTVSSEGSSLGNIRIGVTTDNEIDTSSGNLTIDSAGGTTIIDDILQIGSGATVSTILDEDNLASDSATALATQQSIKAYVDNAVGSLSSTTITEGNSSLVVSDSGSNGTLTFTADGNTELVINDTSATFSGNVQVDGNLNVSGTTTTVNTTNVLISDPIQVLSATNSGGADVDSGIMIERGSAGNNAVFYWNEGADKFKAVTSTSGHDATAITDSATATIVANIEGNVTGNVTGNADTATAMSSAVTVQLTGDVTGSATFTSAGDTASISTTVAANSVALGTDTTGNYVQQGATSGNGISGSVNSEGGTFTVTSNATNANTASTIVFRDASGNFSAGTITANLTGTATAAQYSDLAERFAADTVYEPGTVVALGGAEEITATQEERSERVFGVVSGEHQAAFKMNGAAGTNETHPYIAMAGRVQVKVLGPISKGDRLVTSVVSGVARRAERDECTAFNVIGRALENKHTDGLGEVLCFVTAKS